MILVTITHSRITQEQGKVIERITKLYIPLIQKSNDIIRTMEEGSEDDATHFLTNELVEVTPEVFHGMTLTERSQSTRSSTLNYSHSQ